MNRIASAILSAAGLWITGLVPTPPQLLALATAARHGNPSMPNPFARRH